jgi:hypothetical protein
VQAGYAGVSVLNLCRKQGTLDATFYKGQTKYAALEVSDVKKLRQLEEENWRLKQMVAEQALDIQKSGGTDSPIGDMTPMEVIHSHQNQGQRS